jgi:mannose-6-phosphate isomerase-like protein (cupin superfamily)
MYILFKVVKVILLITMNDDNAVLKPWGRLILLADYKTYKVVLLEISPGQRLSLQRHQSRWEHWIIVKGTALVTLNDHITTLSIGECISIQRKDIHRVENPSEKDILQFIEVQFGDYLSDEDIERFEDDYGRIKPR